jgi:hypothetical protein
MRSREFPAFGVMLGVSAPIRSGPGDTLAPSASMNRSA